MRDIRSEVNSEVLLTTQKQRLKLNVMDKHTANRNIFGITSEIEGEIAIPDATLQIRTHLSIASKDGDRDT